MRREQNPCLLPQVDSQMLMATLDSYTDLAVALLTHYSFDLGGYDVQEIVTQWQAHYPINWLHLAVIEALYQGRYKAFSVQQILSMWHRRHQATYHFNMEFERLICSKFPVSLTANQPLALSSAPSSSNPQLQPESDYIQPNTQLNQNQTWQQSNPHKSVQQKLSHESSFHLIESGRHYLKDQDDIRRLTPATIDREQTSEESRISQNQSQFHKARSDQQKVEHLLPVRSEIGMGVSSTVSVYQTVNPPIPHFQPQANQDCQKLNPPVKPVENDFSETFSEQLSEQMSQLSSSATNHPPIGQFTPQSDDSSVNFTSKLYAMVTKE